MHCSNGGSLELSNNNTTVTKKGPDGIGVIFGTHQFEADEEYSWKVTV